MNQFPKWEKNISMNFHLWKWPKSLKETLTNTSCAVGDYHIPEGCIVLCNIWRFLRDPAYWQDPDRFMPERFLSTSAEGVLEVVVPEHFIPFGIGRRVCPGESLARQELFTMVVRMVQRLRIEVPSGTTKSHLDHMEAMGITRTTKPFHVNLVQI